AVNHSTPVQGSSAKTASASSLGCATSRTPPSSKSLSSWRFVALSKRPWSGKQPRSPTCNRPSRATPCSRDHACASLNAGRTRPCRSPKTRYVEGRMAGFLECVLELKEPGDDGKVRSARSRLLVRPGAELRLDHGL